MAIKNQADLEAQATAIKDEVIKKANTSDRIGQMLIDFIQSVYDAKIGQGQTDLTEALILVLQSIFLGTTGQPLTRLSVNVNSNSSTQGIEFVRTNASNNTQFYFQLKGAVHDMIAQQTGAGENGLKVRFGVSRYVTVPTDDCFIEYSTLEGMKVIDTLHNKGLFGAVDFSAAYTANSYVQKAWVEAQIAAINAGSAGIHPGVQDLTALKALDTTSAATYPDKYYINVEDSGLYRHDRDSAAASDEPRTVVPTTGVGRWIKVSSQLSSHNLMDLIQGGTVGEYYHLTAAQHAIAAAAEAAYLQAEKDKLAKAVISDPTGIAGADAVTNIVSLTQAEYDAIVAPDPATVYIITDSQEAGLLKVVGQMSAAQAAGSFTAPHDLLPAPAAGKYISVESIALSKPAGTAFATNTSFRIKIGAQYLTGTIGGFLNASTDKAYMPAITNHSPDIASPLSFEVQVGDATGGSPVNFTIIYKILDV